VEFHVWDIARFHRLHESRSGRDDLAIDLSALVDGGLPCIEAGTDSDDYAAYLCVVPGRVLAEMYEEYGAASSRPTCDRSSRSKVASNKGIRNTILHDASSFFAQTTASRRPHQRSRSRTAITSETRQRDRPADRQRGTDDRVHRFGASQRPRLTRSRLRSDEAVSDRS